MKIGILTHFNKSTNYGGVLQAYALCKYLNNKGHLARQILYKHQVSRVSESSVTIVDLIKRVKMKMENTILKDRNQQIEKHRESLFSAFRSNVPHTEHEYSKSNIADVNKEFDLFITGSDQVWNPFWYDSSYMLDFVDDEKVKISYAASIGVSCLDKMQENIYKKYLSRFRAVSVREKAASNLLSSIIGKDVKVSVDPTLLLSADDWDEVASNRKIECKYIFLYLLGDDKKVRRLAEKFANVKGLRLIIIPDLLGTYRSCDRKINGELLTDVTPEDFLSLVKYAEYIITDSFHACIFSFLYKREFFVFKRNGNIKMDSRIQTITELFECPEHFCKRSKEMSLEYLLSIPTIDYSEKFEGFFRERQKAIDFLDKNLI